MAIAWDFEEKQQAVCAKLASNVGMAATPLNYRTENGSGGAEIATAVNMIISLS